MAAVTGANETISEPYRSLPLPQGSKCVRLLQIYPQSVPTDDGAGGPIEGQLIVADLDKTIAFSALSYVWGKPPPPTSAKTIRCGDFNIPITENCHSALIHLRRQVLNLTIWIDAVCINQKDDTEKAHQISLMKYIYPNAAQVYVWLGESDPAKDRAMEYLSTTGLREYFFVNGDPEGDELSVSRPWAAAKRAFFISLHNNKRIFVFDPDKVYTGPIMFPNWMGLSRTVDVTHRELNDLLTSDWMERIWTHQEIILAANAVVVCGDSLIPWTQFSIGITFLHRFGEGLRSGVPIESTTSSWKRVIVTKGRIEKYIGGSSIERLARYEDFLDQVATKYDILIRGYIRVHATIGVSACVGFLIVIVSGVFFGLARSKGTKSPGGSIMVNGGSSSVELREKQWLSVMVVFATATAILSILYGMGVLHWYIAVCGPLKTSVKGDKTKKPTEEAEGDIVDHLNDAIYSRKATDPKDLAFGLRAVLEILMEHDMPPPDYSKSLHEIQKQLAAQLSELGGTLQLLLPAALTHLPGTPSWLPSWQADLEPQKFWLRTLPSAYSFQFSEQNCWNSAQEWKLDLEKETLTARGRKICGVASFLDFKETSDEYDKKEAPLHLANIQAMLELFHSESGKKLAIDYLFDQNNHSKPSNDLTPRHFIGYREFLLHYQQQTPSKLLSLMRLGKLLETASEKVRKALFIDDVALSPSYQSALRVHIWVCNSIVQSKRCIFKGTPLDTGCDEEPSSDKAVGRASDPAIFGICTSSTKAEDSVVQLERLSLPVIIRQVSASFQLISPAVMEIGHIDGPEAFSTEFVLS